MMRLIKKELYKLRTSKLFIVSMIICFSLNALFIMGIPLLMKVISPDTAMPVNKLSALIADPFNVGLVLIVIYISVVSFLYLDFAGGFIKNIAGQAKRTDLVIAKFFAVAVHNLIFFAVGALSNIVGALGTGNFVVDGDVMGGVMTFLLRWLLSLAVCAILLLIAVGMTSKTFAIVMAVLFSTGTFTLIYNGISFGVNSLLKTDSFQLSHYMPDGLYGNVNAVTGDLVVNSIIVSVVFIILFVTLTCVVFKKRDVK